MEKTIKYANSLLPGFLHIDLMGIFCFIVPITENVTFKKMNTFNYLFFLFYAARKLFCGEE